MVKICCCEPTTTTTTTTTTNNNLNDMSVPVLKSLKGRPRPLKLKKPGFVIESFVEGNLAVVTHPNDPITYGDGSAQFDGTVSTDSISAATDNAPVQMLSPLSFSTPTERPSFPSPGFVQMYSDPTSQGRLVMVTSAGDVTDINPLRRIGDVMTFDDVKKTTVRIPTGLPQQHLVSDPEANPSGRLSWSTNRMLLQDAYTTSDQYLRYLAAGCSDVLPLTTDPQTIPIDTVYRCDFDTFAVSAGNVTVNKDGWYEILVKANVTFDPDVVQNISAGTVVAFQTYAEIDATGSGFSPIPAGTFTTNFPYCADSIVRSPQTVTIRQFLNISANSQLRFRINEITSTHAVIVPPYNCHVYITKLAWTGNSSIGDGGEYLVAAGAVGSRPVVTTSASVVAMSSPAIFSTDATDAVNADGTIALGQAGMREIAAKLLFASNNANEDLVCVISVSLTSNGTSIGNPAQITLLGANGSTTVCVNELYDANAGDTIVLQAIVESSNLTVGSVTAIAEQCTIAVFAPDASSWKKAYVTSNGSQLLLSNKYDGIKFPTSVFLDEDEYVSYGTDGTVLSLETGGSYRYVYGIDFQNQDNSEPRSAMARLLANTGAGYTEIVGSRVFVSLAADAIQSAYTAGVIYANPHTKIKVELLAPDGGAVQVSNGYVVLSKYEYTKSPFVGLPDFGRFYRYVYDENEMATTSTTFALRLESATVGLPAGNYRIGLCFEWNMTNWGVQFEVQLTLDSNTVVEDYSNVPAFVGSYSRVTVFQVVTLTDGEHTFAVMVRTGDASCALYTRKVRMEFWKVPYASSQSEPYLNV